MKKELEFKLKDGTSDWYDPVDDETGLTETDTHYLVFNTYYQYEIEKSTVEEYIWHPL